MAFTAESILVTYQTHIAQQGYQLTAPTIAWVKATISAGNWDDPNLPSELNNYAVIALIEAEQAADALTRSMYLDMAISALSQGAEADGVLCKAHLAYLYSIIGQPNQAAALASPTLLTTLHAAFKTTATSKPQLVYLPGSRRGRSQSQGELWSMLLTATSAAAQAIILCSEALCQSQLVLYNPQGVRLLNLKMQVQAEAIVPKLQRGIYGFTIGQQEALIYLHQAAQLNPNHGRIAQALYLAYRDLGLTATAYDWWQIGQTQAQGTSVDPEWQWGSVSTSQPFTYVAFDQLTVAVEPTLQSIVTRVLLADQDWFEAELEFWRDRIQPGMTVIDVGANAGVYTFSAASRVGDSGRVLAVEPFIGCINCLQETRRSNGLDWVTICQGAASDHDGMIRFALHSASELNEVVTDDQTPEQTGVQYTETPCFKLDTLAEKYELQTVDFLKVDAEGHELQVFQGGHKLLATHKPTILYENLVGDKSNNAVVPEFLRSLGYELFQYQPFMRQLIPIGVEPQAMTMLNVIAIHRDIIDEFT